MHVQVQVQIPPSHPNPSIRFGTAAAGLDTPMFPWLSLHPPYFFPQDRQLSVVPLEEPTAI